MSSEPSSTPTPAGAAGSGFPENVAGALSYVLGPVTGAVFLVIDGERPFVRFHAVQSIGVSVVAMIVWVAMMVLSAVLNIIPFLGFLIGLALSLAMSLGFFALWIILILKAYRGQEWEVPVVGVQLRQFAKAVASSAAAGGTAEPTPIAAEPLPAAPPPKAPAPSEPRPAATESSEGAVAEPPEDVEEEPPETE